MAVLDSILQALESGGQAGIGALAGAGRDLATDFEKFVAPHLRDIAAQLAAITAKRLDGTFTDITAKQLIDSEEDALATLVETMESLSAYEMQTVVNAMLDAMNKAINAALGFALLA